MSGLKRLSHDELRVKAPKGRKVIWIWDKAGINFRQWHEWKSQSGIYFISLEKKNMKLDEIAIPLKFDRNYPFNEGVEADELCATSQGISVRRITYTDPVTGKRFKFITNVTTLDVPPGAIAQLYRMRWDIEKIFDDVKNKLNEKKAWATSESAKTVQAEVISLTFNLMRIFEQIIAKEHNIINKAEDIRRAERMEEARTEAAKKGGRLPSLYEDLIRATQISVKFIRWIRYSVWEQDPDKAPLKELEDIYAKL